MKPVITEAFSCNGEFSHFRLIDESTGKLLWTSDPESDKSLWLGDVPVLNVFNPPEKPNEPIYITWDAGQDTGSVTIDFEKDTCEAEYQYRTLNAIAKHNKHIQNNITSGLFFTAERQCILIDLLCKNDIESYRQMCKSGHHINHFDNE